MGQIPSQSMQLLPTYKKSYQGCYRGQMGMRHITSRISHCV